MPPEYPKYTERRVAEILRVDPVHPDTAIIERAAACLRSGGLVAFPTETVYGLGADATNTDAVRRVFAAKGRPSTDPLIVHVPDLDSVRPLVSHLTDSAVTVARALWPGPLTLVLPRSGLIGTEVTAGLETVAVRVPAHPVARALVIAARVPVAAPSANLFSRPSPTRAEHVADDLGDAIDLIVDAGATLVGLESTVLDLTSDPPRVLRPGGVSLERLRELLPNVVLRDVQASPTDAMRSPGMLSKHYAPRTPLTLFEGNTQDVLDRIAAEVGVAIERGERVALLGTHEMLARAKQAIGALPAITFLEIGSDSSAAGIASRLYASLRDCDAAGVDRVLALQVADDRGIALAVRDRLRRASAGDIVRC